MRRVLVETNPDAFSPDLAHSLSNLSNSRRTALAMSTSTGMSSRARARISITHVKEQAQGMTGGSTHVRMPLRLRSGGCHGASAPPDAAGRIP